MGISVVYLQQIAVELEADAGIINTGADTNYWRRIALAAESFAGVSSTANKSKQGYQLRTAVAFETMAGVSHPEYGKNENGYLTRIMTALGTINGTTYVGISGQVFLQAVRDLGGASNIFMSGGIVREDHNTTNAVATFTLSGATDSGWTLDDNGEQDNLVIDSSGVLRRAANEAFDYETWPQLHIVVRNGSVTNNFTITITDVVEVSASDIPAVFVSLGMI